MQIKGQIKAKFVKGVNVKRPPKLSKRNKDRPQAQVNVIREEERKEERKKSKKTESYRRQRLEPNVHVISPPMVTRGHDKKTGKYLAWYSTGVPAETGLDSTRSGYAGPTRTSSTATIFKWDRARTADGVVV